MNDKTLLTTREAAAYLNVKERTLGQHWFRWGLRPYRVGRSNRYAVADLDRYLADHRISEPSRQQLRTADHNGRMPSRRVA